MPDILIRGAEIPKSCAVCKIRSYNAYCPLNETIKFMYDPTNRGFDFCTGTHPKCPLEQLSEHGDLVDVSKISLQEYEQAAHDALHNGKGSILYDCGVLAGAMAITQFVRRQPVIVPASKEDLNTMGEFMRGQECGNPEDGSL